MPLDTIPVAFRNAVVTGDARELAKQLPAGSIDLCLCDPVYQRIEDYAWLGDVCERVLSPGGSLIVQCASLFRFECEVALRRSRLHYVDLLAEVYPFALQALWSTRVQVGWKPHLWFSKGPWQSFGDREAEWIVNRVHAGGKRKADTSKDLHAWGDSEEFAAGLIGKLCGPWSVVWDPFTGSGTVPAAAKRLRRAFAAFEIDPIAAEKARHRLSGTHPERRFIQRTFDLEEAAS